MAMLLNHCDIAGHQRERFRFAILAPSQCRYRFGMQGIASQMKSSYPFDGDNLSLCDPLACGVYRIRLRRIEGVPRGVHQVHVRATHRAGIRLCVKAATCWIVIFACAVRAHRKCAYGRPLTIIGDVLHNRKARSAIGAVNKWVAITPVGRVAQFSETVLAGTNVRRDGDTFLAVRSALDDAEGAIVYQLYMVAALDRLDAGERRRVRSQFAEEVLNGVVFPLDINTHASGGIADLTAESSLPGEGEH